MKNKVRGLTLPDFKTYCKATVTKVVCTGIKADIRKSTESPEINPCMYYGQMTFDKDAKPFNGGKSPFQ